MTAQYSSLSTRDGPVSSELEWILSSMEVFSVTENVDSKTGPVRIGCAANTLADGGVSTVRVHMPVRKVQ